MFPAILSRHKLLPVHFKFWAPLRVLPLLLLQPHWQPRLAMCLQNHFQHTYPPWPMFKLYSGCYKNTTNCCLTCQWLKYTQASGLSKSTYGIYSFTHTSQPIWLLAPSFFTSTIPLTHHLYVFLLAFLSFAIFLIEGPPFIWLDHLIRYLLLRKLRSM